MCSELCIRFTVECPATVPGRDSTPAGLTAGWPIGGPGPPALRLALPVANLTVRDGSLSAVQMPACHAPFKFPALPVGGPARALSSHVTTLPVAGPGRLGPAAPATLLRALAGHGATVTGNLKLPQCSQV